MKKKRLYFIIAAVLVIAAFVTGIALGSRTSSNDPAQSGAPTVTAAAGEAGTAPTDEPVTTSAVGDTGAEPTDEPAVTSPAGDTGAEPTDGPAVTSTAGDTGAEPTDEPAVTSTAGDTGAEPTDEPVTTNAADDTGAAPTDGPEPTDVSGITPSPATTAVPSATPTPVTTAVPSATPTPAPTGKPIKAETGSPLEMHGRLKVDGTRLVDRDGEEYRLRGVSTHGLAWFPDYVNRKSFETIRNVWGANCIRLAMYTAEYGGYCSGGDKNNLKKLIDNGVQYATELGMYVIIDWHILSDSNPLTNKAEALKFFEEMSARYSDHENILYEICNEPNGGTDWSDIRKYAEEVIPVIRANSPDSIIIVGTPTWSQEVDKPAADPIRGYDNIMYTIHFYAGTHKDDLRKRMRSAVKSGIAIFCTEFGTCDASGNGSNNFDEADKWIDAMEEAGVSYCIWNLSNKSETSALISSSCSKTSGWSENDLSASGKWYVKLLNGGRIPQAGNATDDGKTGGHDRDNNDTGKTGDHDRDNDDAGKGGRDDKGSDTVTVSEGRLVVSVTESGSWNDGSRDFHQYTVKIENTGGGAVSGWKCTLTFGSEYTLDQSWNGTFDSSDRKKLIVSPVEHNNNIGPGASAEFGFIIAGEQSGELPKVGIE